MNYKKLTLCLCLSGIFLTCGCTSPVTTSTNLPAATYTAGGLEAMLPYGINHVYQATLAGLQQLQIKTSVTKVDDLSGTVTAFRSDGKKITIKLRHIQQGTTKFNMRIGIVGDAPHSMMIYEKIASNL